MKQPEPFGKYLLLGQVAVGGMAEIYKARYADPSMPQIDIAVKRILPSYTEDESFVTMFKDEGNIAQRLDHPNIVKVYEVGEVNSDWYIAMEYIRGTDIRILSDLCEKYGKRFSPTQIARVMCETAKALDYAHKRQDEEGNPLNIVHRDCTPHNIMVSQTGEVKLMDFGIAKAASRATKTRVGTVKGKSSYMSPEQARGKQLDGRSDMFTLGTVGWELLTGQRLFKASSDFEILTKVLKAELIHPSDLDSKIPRELGDIVMKTLERDRDLRYPDCGEFAKALEDWIEVNGDGSDSHLGDVVLCLTNKQGHSFSELQNYVPGESLYDCVDGEFVKKAGAPRSTMAYAPATQSVPPTAAQPVVVQPPCPSAPDVQSSNPYMPPGYPDPNMPGMPTPTVKLTPGYIAAFFFIGLAIIASVALALYYSGLERPQEVVFVPPEATLQLKTRPEGATVLINHELLVDENKKPLLTPIYTYKVPLLEDCKITFEKDGYEPVELERKIVFLTEDVSADMMTEEEARKAKMDHFDKFTIVTEPSGAMVMVNGDEIGKSPVELENVKFDESLSLSVSLAGYENWKRTISPSRDDEPELKINLKEAQVATAPVVHNTTPKTPKTKTPQQPAAASGPGNLTIESTPWSIVMIDGQRIGSNTSVKKKSLSAGTHTIQLTCPSKGGIKSTPRKLKVNAGQSYTLKYDFNANKWLN